ncbi:MAG: trypsin-like peptidase domain-containing protein, partial [Desulfobacteraceae bacterium]|nr:trypsin-like peptidase domain-containing protein [Desulfobacteraceae bacterium]
EGEKAFNRLPELSDSVDPSDVYYLTSAHRTDKKGNLRIVGVPRSITKTGELIRSPFKNDFAVLKIDDIPENLKPLPLAGKIDPQDIQRLSPVLILGFPLGHKTQDDHINASVTRGHVRRTSKEMIQVDSSIYKGNSGGPAINSNGQVIGIATGVVTDQTPGYFKVLTPLSDFGLILPISRPASFIENLKIGQLKWNGIIDFSVENKLEQIKALAFENKFNEAAFLATEFTDSGNEPLLFFAAGMLNFCSNNFEKSKGFFYKVTSIEAENTSSKLMIFVMDWLDGTTSDKEFTKGLLNMDWRHPDEFLGYLVQVIKNSSRMDLDYLEWENMAEMGWRYFIEGLMLEKEKNFSDAANMFKQAILNSGVDEWVYFLSFSRLQLIQNQHIKFVADKEKYRQETEAFKKTAIQKREESSEKGKIIASLIQRSEAGNTTYEEKLQIYEALLAIAPDNRAVLAKMAFFYATNSVWEKALEYIHAYMEVPGRETALSLSLGLLKGQIFNITDQKDKAKKHLEKFRKETKDSWYSIIGKNLLSGPNETALIKIAGKNPEKLITMHTALGLWAEGAQDKERAAHHYREALGSYLDNRMEYYLALGRIVRFRQNLD